MRRDRQFVVVSADGSGLGWALLLKREGERVIFATAPDPDEDDDALKCFAQVGRGLVPSMPLPAALSRYGSEATTIWIWDGNHSVKTSEKLRTAGQRVLGASTFADQMEHDRQAAQAFAHRAGLSIPEHDECSTIEQGLAFLAAHPDQAFVMKPNAGSSAATCVPDARDDPQANEEIRRRLRKLTPADVQTGYILQERKQGVEVCTELWLVDGEPVLATVDLESKRKSEGDHGVFVGCSQDVVFTVPLDCRLIRETVGTFLPQLRAARYTGFADCNAILADRQVWYLESGFRWGYNGSVNLIVNLALDPFGDLMDDFLGGRVDGFAERFRQGFGASICLMLDHTEPGLPFTRKDWAESHYYAYDLAKDDNGLMLTGWSNEVGIYCRHAYTLEEAAEHALSDLHVEEAVSFTNCDWRSDLAKTDYENAPARRLQALQAMRMFDR